MLPINEDIILNISEFLTDKEKIKLTMISKLMDKFKFAYRDKISICKITNLSYFENFENIGIYLIKNERIPKKIKYIHFEAQTILFNIMTKNNLHGITHLTFGMGI